MQAHSPHIHRQFAGGVLKLVLDRPEKKNAIDQAMYETLAHYLREADEIDEVRVVLLTGQPDCFTSGNDIADFMGSFSSLADGPVVRFLVSLRERVKPMVAAVQGPAVGIGTTLLLHCDLVYAGSGATFQLPFVNLGLCPEAGSSYLLPLFAGARRASEWLLLGEPFSADSALAAGIVTAVVPDGDVGQTAQAAARKLAAQPPGALRIARQLLREPHREALAEAMEKEFELFRGRLASPEAKEACTAFMEKRPPDFSKFT